MFKSDVQELQCPFCTTAFQVGDVWRSQGKVIEYGSLFCSCDEFPIVAGILFLFRPQHRTVLEHLRNSEFAAAFLLSCTQKKFLQPGNFWMKPVVRLIAAQSDLVTAARQLGKENITRLLSFVTSKHLIKYYFEREMWKDSLTLALPVAVLLSQHKDKKKKTVWFDVGAGVVNYYGQLQQVWPGLVLISEDSSFINMFLSRAFYPGKRVSRICADANILPVIRARHADIVTFIDSLDSLSSTTAVLRQVLEKGWLKASSMLFVSGLQEHLYVDKKWGLFPVPKKTVEQLFRQKKRSPIYLDTNVLSDSIVEGEITLKKILLSAKPSRFRYSFFWSEQLTLPEVMSTHFLSKVTRSTAKLIWEKPAKVWQCRAY